MKHVVTVMAACMFAGAIGFAADGVFFTDSLDEEGMYVYAYPETSSVKVDTMVKKEGTASLKIMLDTQNYAGVGIGRYPAIDLRALKETATLSFWIKGDVGGERIKVALVDSDEYDGVKLESAVAVPKYIEGRKIDTEWKLVEIPLKEFPDTGTAWLKDEARLFKGEMEWFDIIEIKFISAPKKGAMSTIWVDDIVIE